MGVCIWGGGGGGGVGRVMARDCIHMGVGGGGLTVYIYP